MDAFARETFGRVDVIVDNAGVMRLRAARRGSWEHMECS
jgi:NADP-dependent 3-hydroxy acid dehydrogenase YdfG